MLPIILLLLGTLIEAKGPHHPHASHHHYHPQPSPHKKLTKDEHILHDKQHINEDLGDKWSDDQYLTDEEMEFRYFKVHDYDNNTKLDGLEIYQAIKHSLDYSNSDVLTEAKIEKEDTIIGLIDQVLLEDDTDFDGYLSYAEYVIGRQKEKDRRNKK
ncbi:multiple coagulation factor deficiency protein 2 homolog [Planococcus citri]|uniref:multiple coagulation factor deficiency protein 2 homolog n=1 Tax=Planococcus citri TaxID=170843 RepID=UPI0031F7823E